MLRAAPHKSLNMNFRVNMVIYSIIGIFWLTTVGNRYIMALVRYISVHKENSIYASKTESGKLKRNPPATALLPGNRRQPPSYHWHPLATPGNRRQPSAAAVNRRQPPATAGNPRQPTKRVLTVEVSKNGTKSRLAGKNY